MILNAFFFYHMIEGLKSKHIYTGFFKEDCGGTLVLCLHKREKKNNNKKKHTHKETNQCFIYLFIFKNNSKCARTMFLFLQKSLRFFRQRLGPESPWRTWFQRHLHFVMFIELSNTTFAKENDYYKLFCIRPWKNANK